MVDPRNESQETRAGSAYRLDQREARLKEKGGTLHVLERASGAKSLTLEQEAANTERSRARYGLNMSLATLGRR